MIHSVWSLDHQEVLHGIGPRLLQINFWVSNLEGASESNLHHSCRKGDVSLCYIQEFCGKNHQTQVPKNFQDLEGPGKQKWTAFRAAQVLTYKQLPYILDHVPSGVSSIV